MTAWRKIPTRFVRLATRAGDAIISIDNDPPGDFDTISVRPPNGPPMHSAPETTGATASPSLPSNPRAACEQVVGVRGGKAWKLLGNGVTISTSSRLVNQT